MSESFPEIRIDRRAQTEEERKLLQSHNETLLQINSTVEHDPSYYGLVRSVIGRLGAGSRILPPITAVHAERVIIGENSIIMPGVLLMAYGGIRIGNNVQISSQVKLLTNNHDLKDPMVLVCKPVVLEDGCWVGTGAFILPGITIGSGAIVGAGSVVTRNVEPHTVVAGNPAKVIRRLDE